MTRKEIYKKSMIQYGFLTLLFIMKKHEDLENYEECQLILDVINAKEFKSLNLPTKYNKDSIDFVRKAFTDIGLTGNFAISNIACYAEEIEKKLKIKNQ